MMDFYDIHDVDSIFIEGADAHRDQRDAILNAALAEARQKAKSF